MKLKAIFLTSVMIFFFPFFSRALTYTDILNGLSGQVPDENAVQDPAAVVDDSPDDTTPPSPPGNFYGFPLSNQVTLSWTNPPDADFARTAIVRKTGSSSDGTVIYEGTDTSFIDTGLTNGTSYTYLAYAFDNVPNYSQPATITVVPDAAKTQMTITSSSTASSATIINTRLINYNGTFYLEANNQLHGITNPGMLASYGFAFGDAAVATAEDLSLPQGALLSPGEGSLVKSDQDQTVYLVSKQVRHAFTSAAVFQALGFKFSSVLVVTNPELQALPRANDLTDGAAAHLPGTDINRYGTVYYLGGDNQLHGYSSLAIYNSWNLANDFSTVVPANAADVSLPLGSDVVLRVKQ